MQKLNRYRFIFLDRDGVINVERPCDYVKNKGEFVFIDGAIDAIATLSRSFEEIFIITNQRGVGRRIMAEGDLVQVHKYMLSEIEKAGGHISHIYYCADVLSSSVNRKPNIGMGFQARRDFPHVDFNESIMVGNSRSDIEFGHKLGMYTVLVGDKYSKEDKIYQNVNQYCENLYSFVLTLQD